MLLSVLVYNDHDFNVESYKQLEEDYTGEWTTVEPIKITSEQCGGKILPANSVEAIFLI